MLEGVVQAPDAPVPLMGDKDDEEVVKLARSHSKRDGKRQRRQLVSIGTNHAARTMEAAAVAAEAAKNKAEAKPRAKPSQEQGCCQGRG
eukprot:gene24436-10036_t